MMILPNRITRKPFVLIPSYVEKSKPVAAILVMLKASLGTAQLRLLTASGRTDLTTKFQPYSDRINRHD